MLNRFCIALAALLFAPIVLTATNTVTTSCSDGGGETGAKVAVAVTLDSDEEITALQLTFPGLAEMAELAEESVRTAGRASGHIATAGTRADGSIALLIYATDMRSIAAGKGEIATFDIFLGNQPVSRNIAVQVKATGASGQEISCSAAPMAVTVYGAKAEFPSGLEYDYGRVPIRSSHNLTIPVRNSGTTDLVISDISFSAADFECSGLPMSIAPGNTGLVNVNFLPLKRGRTSTVATLECNSAGDDRSIRIFATPYAVNILQVQGESAESGTEVTVRLNVSNMDDITGFTFEFDMPKELQYVEGSASLSARKTDHNLIASLKDNTLHLTAFSLSDTPFSGHEGTIAEFKVLLTGRYGANLTPSKTVMTAEVDGEVCDVTSESRGTYMDIYYPYIYIPDGLNFGRTEMETAATGELGIYNWGSGKLVIDRLVFDGIEASPNVDLPLVIEAGGSKNIEFTFKSKTEGQQTGRLLVYSNDPENGLWKVDVSADRYVRNEFTINTETDGSFTLNLVNRNPISAMQFDLRIPEGVSVETCEAIGRAQGFTTTCRDLGVNCLRFFCYSLSGSEVESGNGAVVRFEPKYADKGVYNFTICNVKLSDAAMTDRHSAIGDYDLEVNYTNETNGIDEFGEASANKPCQYFDLQGREVTSPNAPGVYIRLQGKRVSKVLR